MKTPRRNEHDLCKIYPLSSVGKVICSLSVVSTVEGIYRTRIQRKEYRQNPLLDDASEILSIPKHSCFVYERRLQAQALTCTLGLHVKADSCSR